MWYYLTIEAIVQPSRFHGSQILQLGRTIDSFFPLTP